jgi:hypothetical protein
MTCRACGAESKWSRNNHAPDCSYIAGLRVKHRYHPSVASLPKRGVDAPHGACEVAYADGRHVCSICAPLLHPLDCECEPCSYTSAHSDDNDDTSIGA